MIVNYADVICGGQVYCAVDIIREHNNIYHHLSFIRWFGEYSGDLACARGEMVALAAINPKFRGETIIISPTTNRKIDVYLAEWRAKYKFLQYSDINQPIDDLLKAEVLVIHDLKDKRILNKIMAKNIPNVLFCQENKNISLILGTEELPIDKVVLCLVKQLDNGDFKVIGFRRAIHKNHLKEIIKQSNDHNLLLYYSPFTVSGSELIADGPWIILPTSLRNFNPSKEFIDDVVMTNENILTDKLNVITETEIETTESKPELVIDENGLVCPYCNKQLKSTYGLTNHINHKHPDRKEEYERAYKA